MKNRHLIVAGLCVLAVSAPSTVLAGKKNKHATNPAATVMAKYDKNSNGTLEDTEKEAIRAALASDPDLKQFDTNNDGKLDDAELESLVKKSTEQAPKKKKKKKDAA